MKTEWQDVSAAQLRTLGNDFVDRAADLVEQSARRHVRNSLRYLDSFLALRCAPDMLAAGLFPNVKEITESMAAYRAARDHLGWDMKDPNVHVVVVGDGCTPRTGATFAFRTKWDVHSVDPVLRMKDYPEISRLRIHRCRVEETTFESPYPTLIVAVHSHATLDNSRLSVKAPKVAAIAMPCCVPLVLNGQDPDLEYEDYGVLSPKRTIKLWRNVS